LWDNGIHLFSSSRFNHGEAVAESNGNFYVINHHDGKIYKTDASGTLTEGKMVIQRMVVRLIFQSLRRYSILIAFFNVFVICRLARTYSKNGGIATGGRIFEPVVLFTVTK
jgi:F-type H+-transporting ATPase subunit a